jgi:hypothetical protein
LTEGIPLKEFAELLSIPGAKELFLEELQKEINAEVLRAIYGKDDSACNEENG